MQEPIREFAGTGHPGSVLGVGKPRAEGRTPNFVPEEGRNQERQRRPVHRFLAKGKGHVGGLAGQ
jgi:hypothetical protein